MQAMEGSNQIKSHVHLVFIFGWDPFKWIVTMFWDRLE